MSVILNALNSVWSDHNPANTRKVDFKDMKSPIKVRDIHKSGKNIGISVFG